VALGLGFRVGCLGLLHGEIVRARLENEVNLDLIAPAPNVIYEVTMEDGTEHTVTNPSEFPPGKIASVLEPMVEATILTPSESVGAVMEMSQQRRGTMKGMDYLSESRVELRYEMLFGSAADALGRKPVLLAGLCSAAAGTALFAIDGVGVTALFAGRVLLGIGLGLGTGAGIALMVEASPAHRPALGSTGATIAFVAGTGAGPVMAGFVATHASAIAAPFLVMLAGLALGGVMVTTTRTGRPLVRQRWRPTWPAVPVQMRSSFTISAVTGLLSWCAVGVFLALLPSMAAAVATH